MLEPLSKVVDLLKAHQVDEHKLCAQLIEVSNDWNTLDHYFGSLSADELKNLRSVVMPERSNRAREVLSRMTVHAQNGDLAMEKALTVLGRVSKSLDSACDDRAEKIMGKETLRCMNTALDNEDRSDVCTRLRQLSVGASKVLAFFGDVPFFTAVGLKNYVEDAMYLLRDHQNNPVGPLNLHSLSKLDDGMRKNLGAAAVVLCNFGLEMEPELRIC